MPALCHTVFVYRPALGSPLDGHAWIALADFDNPQDAQECLEEAIAARGADTWGNLKRYRIVTFSER